jgi:hypothetical protein
VVGLSMTKTVNPFRVGGVVLTAIVGVTLGTRLVVLAVSQLPL